MDKYLEIATALAGKSLTYFIGTGFSKHLTDNNAPSWVELLVESSDRIDALTGRSELLNSLFEKDSDGNTICKHDILVCAQILELEYKKRKMD